MRGIEYLVDDRGNRRAVVINLRKWGKRWARLQEALVAEPFGVGPESGDVGGKSLDDSFRELAEMWHRETSHLSSITAKSVHPAYQRIIGLGRQAVPLMLRELEREPDHWFWALSAITGEDPIPPEHAGQMDRMAEAWLRFGKDHGYL